MHTTLDLLEKALAQKPATYWTERLNLARTTLATAKVRGHLSPSIAGALAEEMGEDAQKWLVIAALEGERDSACKSRMVRKFLTGAALAGTLMGASGAATASVVSTAQTAGECILCLIARLRKKLVSLSSLQFA